MLISRFEGSATLDNIRHLRSLFTCERLGIRVPQTVLDDLCLAISELAANALDHSTKPPTDMEMDVFAEGTLLRIEFRDNGDPFHDFERRWSEGQMAPMDPLAEGGRGMWLVRNAVDNLSYEHIPSEQGGTNKWSVWRSLSARAKPAILLVEDDATTRGLFVTSLSRMAHVSCASSLAEARSALTDTAFDLVIADYNLGDGNSADLMEGFRAEGVELDMPFIFATGDRTGKAREVGLQHGIHTILEKPVRPRELLERANEAIAAHHAHELRASRRLVRNVDPLIAMRKQGVVSGFRIAAGAAVASTGGGDIFVDLGSEEIGGNNCHRFALADCVGHGMPARMQAAVLSGLMAGITHHPLEGPANFIDALSDLIYRGGIADGLIATVLAVNLLDGYRIELATGGHPSPMIIAADGTMRPVRLSGGLPGLLPKANAEAVLLQLDRGERLLLATDGIAPDSTDILSGMSSGLVKLFKASPAQSLTAVVSNLENGLKDILGPYPMDDWTFVLIEREDFQPAS